MYQRLPGEFGSANRTAVDWGATQAIWPQVLENALAQYYGNGTGYDGGIVGEVAPENWTGS
jgi:hypothetical protein